MEYVRPTSWTEALAVKSARPHALPIAGGTDVMVDLNFGRRRPDLLLDLSGVDSLAQWAPVGDLLRIGAAVTYRQIIDELAGYVPGLVTAARTVGSPQIRNRGTLGGNLGTASPAGDLHPPLLARDAVLEVASTRGVRRVPVGAFFTGPRRNALAPDELIAAVLISPADGPEQFAKVGTRNAMVVAACSFALAIHSERECVGTGIGSAAPTPLSARQAEAFAKAELPWRSRCAIAEATAHRFGELVAAAAAPIDDIRASAAYRARALAVLARRTLVWAWEEHRCS